MLMKLTPNDSQSKPWSSDVGLNPGFHKKVDGKDGPLDSIKNENNKDSQRGQVTPKKYLNKRN